MSRHCFSVSSLISLFICRNRVLNVVTKFFYHLPYSLSQQNNQMSRHSSDFPSLVLLRYSFPCHKKNYGLLKQLFSCNVVTVHLLSDFHCVVTFIYVLQHFSCISSHIMSRQNCENGKTIFRLSSSTLLGLCSNTVLFVSTNFCKLPWGFVSTL